MILTQLKSYLKINKRASLIDLAHHFNVTPEAMKGMLEHWIRKGKVRYLENQLCQKGCCCPTQLTHLEIYEWLEAENEDTV